MANKKGRSITTVAFDPPVYSAIRRYCQEKGITFQRLVELGITSVMAKEGYLLGSLKRQRRKKSVVPPSLFPEFSELPESKRVKERKGLNQNEASGRESNSKDRAKDKRSRQRVAMQEGSDVAGESLKSVRSPSRAAKNRSRERVVLKSGKAGTSRAERGEENAG